MNLPSLHAKLYDRLSRIDFSALHPSFHAYPFALYTHETVCLGGRIFPNEGGFCGNTAIEYDGQFIAIWDIEADPVNDTDLLASQLVHEMFHCHQHFLSEHRYPSDLSMLAVSESPVYYWLKQQEYTYLADTCEYEDRNAFQRFALARQTRQTLFPDAVKQELLAESIEGTAEFTGLEALRQLDVAKHRLRVQMFLSLLRQPKELLFDTRRLCYYSGAMLLLALRQLGFAPVNDILDTRTIWEQNLFNLACAAGNASEIDHIASALHIHAEKRRATLAAFIQKAVFIPFEASICGYDPMNMFRVGERIYCSHFAHLQQGDTTRPINEPVVLQLAPDTFDRIIGYYKEVS